jgi:hypothetical protein
VVDLPLVIVLSDLPLVIVLSDLPLVIVLSDLPLVIVLSDLLQFTASYHPFGIVNLSLTMNMC